MLITPTEQVYRLAIPLAYANYRVAILRLGIHFPNGLTAREKEQILERIRDSFKYDLVSDEPQNNLLEVEGLEHEIP